MKKFEDLTYLGRIRRCRKIIVEGLKAYNIEVEKLSFLEEATNVFYKIVDKSGNKYAVKVYQELSSDLNDALVEMYFLNEVLTKTHITVPKPIKNKKGQYITLVETPYDTVEKRMAIYQWMDGKDLDEREKIEHFPLIGKMMASMHEMSKTIDVPDTIRAKRMDKVLYYAGDDYFYRMSKHKEHVTEEFISFMDKVIPYLDKKLMKLYEHDTFLIHGDFNPYNIRLNKNEIRLLDFEDTSYATSIHDVAIFLFYYRYDDNYEAYKKAFFEGYHEISAEVFSEADIELVMAARRVNFLNYILEIHDSPEDYIEKNRARLDDYLNQFCPDF